MPSLGASGRGQGGLLYEGGREAAEHHGFTRG